MRQIIRKDRQSLINDDGHKQNDRSIVMVCHHGIARWMMFVLHVHFSIDGKWHVVVQLHAGGAALVAAHAAGAATAGGAALVAAQFPTGASRAGRSRQARPLPRRGTLAPGEGVFA